MQHWDKNYKCRSFMREIKTLKSINNIISPTLTVPLSELHVFLSLKCDHKCC